MTTRPIVGVLRVLGLPAAALVLAACGAGEPSDDRGAAPAATGSADCVDDSTETSTGAVSLIDSFGREVELEQPAERVAVLEWQQTEDLLSLCVTPVAVADAEGYSLWDTAEELPEDVEDVGTRGEPDVEALLATDPDLVIVEAYTPNDDIITQLEKHDVPVLATQGADIDDPIRNMIDTFELIARATGREERADDVVEEFENHLAYAKEEVAAEHTDVDEFVYFDGWTQDGMLVIRPYGQGSLMGELGEELGLTNAWNGTVDPAYGLGQTDLAGLSQVGDASLYYTGTEDPAGDIIADLEKHRRWSSIPGVEEGRTYAFPSGIWTFGGPRSAVQAIDAYVEVLTR